MKTINTAQNLVIPNKWDGKDFKSQELLENLNSVSNEQISTISNEINEYQEYREKKQRERKEYNENLYWNVDWIIKYVKENFVEETDWEFLWEKWKDIHVKLPAIWDFEWFDTVFFISDSFFTRESIELNQQINQSLIWANSSDMWLFLKALKKYLKANWVETKLVIPATSDWIQTTVGYCLKQILWLYGSYWARNSDFKKWEFRFLYTDWDLYYSEKSDWSEELRLLLRKE